MKLLFLILSSLSLSLYAYTQSWEELNDQLKVLSAKKDFVNAIPVAEKAVIAAQKKFGGENISYVSNVNYLAVLYQVTGQYEKAEPLFIQAERILKKTVGETHPNYITSLYNLAVLYEKMHHPEKAEQFYIQIINLKKKSGENNNDYANSLDNLAGLYISIAQYEKAEPLYIEATAIRKKLFGEDAWYAYSLHNEGVLYEKLMQYKKAETQYTLVREILKKIKGEMNLDYAVNLSDLASVFQKTSEYEKADQLLTQAKKILEKVTGEGSLYYASIIERQGSLYLTIRQLEKAEPLIIKAREIRKKIEGESNLNYASILNLLSKLYLVMGQYEKVEPLLFQSLTITKNVAGEDSKPYAENLDDLGNLYMVMGQYEKAEPPYLQAKGIRKKLSGENNDYTISLNYLANLYSMMGQYEKAEPLYIQAKELREKILGKNHSEYAVSLNNLAALYVNKGQYEKAEPLYIQAKEIAEKTIGEKHTDYATIVDNLGALYLYMGQYEKAKPLILSGINIRLQNLKNTFVILSEKEKENYLVNKEGMTETPNKLLYKYRKASSFLSIENFNLQIFIKSLSLADTRSMLESINNSKDIAVEKLFNEWQDNKKLLAKQYSLSLNRREKKIDSIEATTEAIEKELTRKSTEFRNQQNAINISMPDIQKRLKQDEAAIEFVRFHLYNKKGVDSVMYAAYVLRKNDSLPQFVTLCEEKQLQQLFDSAGTTNTMMVNNFYRGLDVGKTGANNFLGAKLYKLIWEPLESYLKGIKKVSHSPAGKLFSIAFHALPVDSATLLMDKYQLQQYTSTRQVALRSQENQTIKPSDIVLFGDANFSMDSLQLIKERTNQSNTDISTSIYTPSTRGSNNNSWPGLPGTADEVKKIKQLFAQNKLSTQSYIQTAASEKNLKALSGHSPQILHIATHGFFLPEPDKKGNENFGSENVYTLANDPLLRSGLILSGGNYAWSGKTPIDGVEDGIATAYEISQLNLSNTELVVLSACETALGDVKGSEGVFGLQRAFKMAGVKKMIVSLWQVPDKETAELMTTFYSYWMKGKTIEESFTQAQADMRKKYSPFYWAAFVLVE